MARRDKPRGPERMPAPLPSVTKEGVAALASVPLFAGLSKGHLKQVAEAAQVATYVPGAMVVADGAPGAAGFFVLLQGTAMVRRGDKDLASLGPGDFFGEFAVIDGGRRTASVVAEETVVALRLPRTAFRKIVEAEPAIAWRIMEVLVQRVREIEDNVSH